MTPTKEQIVEAAIEFSEDYENGRRLYHDGFIAGANWALSQNGWIPIGERLPEDGQEVLCVWRGGMYLAEYQDGVFMVDGETNTTVKATHWQPLPPPPQASE